MNLSLHSWSLALSLLVAGCGVPDAKIPQEPLDSGMTEAGTEQDADTQTASPDATPDGQTDPFSVHGLGRGMNLGNALDAPTEGAWGMTLQADYFQLIAQAGFDTVRLPVRWSAHTSQTAPFEIDSTFMARVDWAVDQALDNDLMIVIDVHHFDELMQDPIGQRDRLLAIWSQLAEHFKDRPPSVGFELLNEPQGNLDSSAWNGLLTELLQLVRQSNPHRTIVVGTSGWNGLDGLSSLQLPPADDNIVVTFHFYEPFHFTHQGASWVDGSGAWLGTTWEGSPEQKQRVDERLDAAATWSATHGRKLWMGEFGSYERADMSSRVRWTRYVARAAEQRGIAWAYWEFGAGFGAYDRERKEWRAPLLGALLPQE